jgi:prepilin peptidase CpaA
MTFAPDSLAAGAGLIAFSGAMIWAAIGDVRTFLITNKLNMLIAAGFLVFALPMGLGLNDVAAHIGIGFLTTLIALAMFLVGVYGGGDAKLTGAAALWLGPAAMMPFILYTAIAGGALVICLILGRRLARQFGLPKGPRWARRLLRKSAAVPYGVALGIGAILATPYTLWFPNILS